MIKLPSHTIAKQYFLARGSPSLNQGDRDRTPTCIGSVSHHCVFVGSSIAGAPIRFSINPGRGMTSDAHTDDAAVQAWIDALSPSTKRQLDWVIQHSTTIERINPTSGTIALWTNILHPSSSTTEMVRCIHSDRQPITAQAASAQLARSQFTDTVFIDGVRSETSALMDTLRVYSLGSSSGRTLRLHIISATAPTSLLSADIPDVLVHTIADIANDLPRLLPWARCPDVTRITIFPFSLMKTFPHSESATGHVHWQPLHINSGVSSDDFGIIIWRRQELLKVVIHELLHLYHLDVSVDDHSEQAALWERLHTPITSVHGPKWNEGFTEALATTIHVAYAAKLHRLTINHCRVFYALEQQHADLMARVICGHTHGAHYTESTAVFSYVVIKHILLNTHTGRLITDQFDHGAPPMYQQMSHAITAALQRWTGMTGAPVRRPPHLYMSVCAV